MAILVKMEAKRGFNCTCCGERIRTCEKMLQVMNNNGSQRRGERYCLECESYAHENNNDISIEQEDDGESHLRAMEDHAAYLAAGMSTEAYLNDRASGFVN